VDKRNFLAACGFIRVQSNHAESTPTPILVVKKLLAFTALMLAAATPLLAQFSTNDPSLKLWLKADTLTGTNVPVWLDSSTNGLVLTAPDLPPGNLQADPDHHTPLLVTNTANGVEIKAVQFRQDSDPLNAANRASTSGSRPPVQRSTFRT
jgi:hypothetical protein